MSAEKRQQPMPVSAEKRQEEFQRLLENFDVLIEICLKQKDKHYFVAAVSYCFIQLPGRLVHHLGVIKDHDKWFIRKIFICFDVLALRTT